MKAYEEWYKKNLYDRTETEKAWRAALEWAKKQSEELCPEIPDSAIGQIIDRELEQ